MEMTLALSRQDLVEALDAVRDKRTRMESGLRRGKLSRTSRVEADIRRLAGVEGRLAAAVEAMT